MLRILSSTSGKPSDYCRPVEREGGRRGGEDNLRWLARQLADERLTAPLKKDGSAPTLCLLLGGRGPYAFRLRIAQSHMRHDLTPSHWSHAALLAPEADDLPEDLAGLPLVEISLEPRGGFGFPPPDNALQMGRLGEYRDRRLYPNIALLRLPVPRAAWQKAPEGDAEGRTGQRAVLDRYREQRSVLDATQLVLEWLGYLWGVGRAGNPLLDGHGIPSAAMIEIVLAASGYDITPGLESRASCPEAIWQAAKWWHQYYEDQNREAVEATFVVEHKLGDEPGRASGSASGGSAERARKSRQG